MNIDNQALTVDFIPVKRDFLIGIADYIGANLCMNQSSPDEPPEYASQFDYDLAQMESEIRSYIAAAPQPAQAALSDPFLPQVFLDWNRAQKVSPVIVSYEYAVFDKVAELIASHQPAAAPALSNGGVKPAGFYVCPISGREFWGNIDHPERGELATYGGPFDTYSIPYLDDDGELRVERFDQDRGEWIEGGEPYGWFYDEQQPEPAAAPVQAAVVPDGYVLVPVEPTPQMLDVGGRAILDTSIESKILWLQGNAHSAYSAMLAAAPAAPSQAPVQPADAAPASQVRDERAEFEAWCTTRDNAAIRLKGTDQYVVPDVQAAWVAWQGRAALAHKPASGEA